MPQPIQYDSAHLDLSARLAVTKTVATSPAASTIAVVGSLTVPGDIAIVSGILLSGWLAFTVGTNGVGATVQIRRTDATGTVVASTGALTVVAANLVEFGVDGFDTGAVLPNQVYALCLTIASGSATSTVSALQLSALVV